MLTDGSVKRLLQRYGDVGGIYEEHSPILDDLVGLVGLMQREIDTGFTINLFMATPSLFFTGLDAALYTWAFHPDW